LPIHQSHTLSGCAIGEAALAVNGRVGRRVACVVGEDGMTLEVFDMEGEDEGDNDTAED
jgi:anaphase-promoting complex subunit 4